MRLCDNVLAVGSLVTRKVIIDCDPGIDDAVALTMALFDPRLEIVAITATEGNVDATQASRNVQAIVEQLDPVRFPRLGAASWAETSATVDARHIHGDDGLGNSHFAVSQLHHQHGSEKVICDAVHSSPNEVTIICLGPLTNIARAFQLDPGLPGIVDRLIMMGGSVNGIGNVTPSAEFNIYYDPVSARAVFRSATTKTLVPLDTTSQVNIPLGFLDELPAEHTRAGCFLRKIVPYAYRAYHQLLGQESVHFHDAVALLAAVQPELFTTRKLAADVETRGELTIGQTVFDRRSNAQWRTNMEVAMEVEAAAALDCIVRGLARAGRES